MSSGVPRYHQVYTVLRQRIADGDYAPGEQLPPEDVLAREWEVSRATLRQAVGLLVTCLVVILFLESSFVFLPLPGDSLVLLADRSAASRDGARLSSGRSRSRCR